MSRRATSCPAPARLFAARARASAATRSFWKTRGLICGTTSPRSCRRGAIIGKTSTGSGARRQRSVSKTSRLRTWTSGLSSRVRARARRASVVRAVTFTGAGKRSSGILANALLGGLLRGRRRPHLLAQRAPRPDLRGAGRGVAGARRRDRVGGGRDDAPARFLGRVERRRVHDCRAVPDRRGALDGRVVLVVRAGRGALARGSLVGAPGGCVSRRRRPQPLDGAARARGDLRGWARAADVPARRRLALRAARPVLLGRRAA